MVYRTIKDLIFRYIVKRFSFDINQRQLYNNKLFNNWLTILSLVFLKAFNSIFAFFNLSGFNDRTIRFISMKSYFYIFAIFIQRFFDLTPILKTRNEKTRYIIKQPLYRYYINLIYISKFIFREDTRYYKLGSILNPDILSYIVSKIYFST